MGSKFTDDKAVGMTLSVHGTHDIQLMIEIIMNRYPALLGLWVVAALALGGCHYCEEESWKICCFLHIIRAEASSPASHAVIIAWQGRTLFSDNGLASDANDSKLSYSWKKGRIESEVADFLTRTVPETPASAYFAGLGLTCRRLTAAQDSATRCEIDMPVTAECWSRNLFFPGGAPLPKELRKPFHAVLRVGVDVSASTVRDVYTQVFPVPGGRLCHR